MSATGRIDESGFTLIEMLVVLAVLALVSGIAFPAVDRALSAQRFGMAAGDVEAALHQARSTAIARGTVTRFVPDAPDRDIALVLPRRGIRFYPDGSADGGVVTIEAGSRKRSLVIDSATGQIGRAP